MDFNKLQNMTPIDLNITQSIGTDSFIPAAINTTNELSSGYYGLGVMLISFLFITFITFKQDGDIRLDIMRSMLFGSGFSLILGIIMLITGFTTSLVHLIWFLVLFATLFIITLNIKKKGF